MSTRSVPSVTAPDGVVDPLRHARDRAGRSPEDWLAESCPVDAAPLLELRCPPRHAGRRIAVRRADVGAEIGADVGIAGWALTSPEALPVADRSVGGVHAAMCLPVVAPLDGLFVELRRVLRPAGTLAALVPSRPGSSLAELRAWRPLHRALGRSRGFPNSSARDQLGWLLAAADFAVLADQRRTFWLPLADERCAPGVVAGLVAAGVWPPDVPTDRLRSAERALARHAAPDRRLPIPLRLLVGRR